MLVCRCQLVFIKIITAGDQISSAVIWSAMMRRLYFFINLYPLTLPSADFTVAMYIPAGSDDRLTTLPSAVSVVRPAVSLIAMLFVPSAARSSLPDIIMPSPSPVTAVTPVPVEPVYMPMLSNLWN